MEDIPEGLIVEVDALTAAPVWRSEPYLLFFPLGVALAWAGVLHWLLHALRVIPDYRPIFHAMTQIQGFLTCFAVGFLFTMVPRRTGSGPPAVWQIAVGLLGPLVTVVAAWNRQWFISQASWLLVALTLVVFAVGRFTSGKSRRRPPNAFVWIPLALLMGITGSVLTLVAPRLDPAGIWLHNFASGLVLQGMFIGFVLGVGSLALPLMTRGAAPPDAAMTAGDWRARAGHLAGAALLVTSFWVQATWSLSLGMLLRAGVILAVYILCTELWRLPTRPGWNAWAIWTAAWMLPTGYLIGAAFPEEYRGGLHVSLIGGLALLAFVVSTQVTLGHGDYPTLRTGKPRQVLVMVVLMFAAMAARLAMEFDPRRFFVWMAVAAFCFLAAATVWLIFLLPKQVRRATGH